MLVHDELDDIYILVGMLVVGLPALVVFISGILKRRWVMTAVSASVLALIVFAVIDSPEEMQKCFAYLHRHPGVMAIGIIIFTLWTLIPVLIMTRIDKK